MFFHKILFIIFGVLIQQLIHNALELWYINLLIKDFQKYGLGLRWEDWFLVHHIGSLLLLVFGLWFGLWLGRKTNNKIRKTQINTTT